MSKFNFFSPTLTKLGLALGMTFASVAIDTSAAPAPSGLKIINIAGATFFNPDLGITETVYSNPVEAIVADVPAIETLGYSDLRLSRGARDQHHFEVRNVGNTDLTLNVEIDSVREEGILRPYSLTWDQNSNGLADTGEPILDATDTLDLAMGDSLFLIYNFDVVETVSADDFAISELRVTPSSTTSGAEVTGAKRAEGIVTIVDAGLEILKSVARRTVDGGEELTYTIALRNNSETAIATYDEIDGNTIRIDGIAESGILVRDGVPLNTTFVSFGNSAELQRLYQLRANPAHDYSSAAPADLSEVSAVAYFLDEDYTVGKSTDMEFTVFLADELGDVTVRNTAQTYLPNVDGVETINSNEVVLNRSSDAGISLDFVTLDTNEPTENGLLGADTMLRLISGACNVSNDIDEINITVASRITGDAETVIARETGANTGVFMTAALPLPYMDFPVAGDGVLASANGDTLDARSVCGGETVTDLFFVNPGNFVFNSVTNAPIADAMVVLVDANGNTVATAVTDRLGFFALGDIAPGTYRYEVITPRDFSFPSVRLTFPGYERLADTRTSYGESFTHGGGPLHIADIPLDPYYGVPLTLEKSADKNEVGTGEFVVYTIIATNNMDQALIGSEILDRFPSGALLVPGSVLLDGKSIADPVGDADGDYRFQLGNMRPLQQMELTYVLRYTALARIGRNYNSAILDGRQAGTGEYRASNVATTYVKHDNSGGVFAREGTIVGSVFMDCNGNGFRDGIEEPGVPGVKIVTQGGLFVVTDIDGKYSLFGLRPVSHVLSLMPDTMPSGAQGVVTRTADLLRGGTRMVSLKRGELRTENFALAGCEPAILEDVKTRVARFEDRNVDASQLLSDLPLNPTVGDIRSVRSEAGVATTTQIYNAEMRAGGAPAPELSNKARETANARQTLESIVRTLSSEPDFIGLLDGQQITTRTISVQIKGPADLELSLSVNGDVISDARIGEKTVWAGGNVQAIEFVALGLKAGKNELVLTGIGPFGNERARQEITITAPGDPAKIEMIAPQSAAATPGSVIPVVVRILDAAGTPVNAASVVTLRARNATWDVTDIRADQAGVQVYIDNGEATFGLMAPQVTGPDLIEVQGNFGRAETEILFTPNLDERILVGIIEGAVALSGRGDLIEQSRISPFEDTTTGLRGEIYLKGVIKGDALLTLRYSSDRDTEDRLFRDIRGDEYYPVYGDNSERGFDAQSSGNLYVKIEQGQSYVLYGDIAIEAESSAFQLGGYNRLTTGAKAHWQDEKVSITVFAARTSQQQKIVEIDGRGISGPYEIDLSDYLEGSDKIELLVRDRDTGEILSTQAQRRGTDYLLDFFRDAIVFNAPVSQTDADGNPVSIRVTYETEGEGQQRYWLYGGEVNYRVSERTTVGARVVHADADEASADRERIRAAYIRTELSDTTRLEIEIAQAENGIGQIDNAARVSLVHEDDVNRLSVEAVHTGRNFDPTGSDTRPGVDQLTIDYTRQFNDNENLSASARYLADRISDTETVQAEVMYERRFNENFSGNIGISVEHDLRADEDATEVSLLAGARWRPESATSLTFNTELEAPVLGNQNGRLSFGADFQVRPNWNARAVVDFEIDSERHIAKATRLQLGMDYQIAGGLTGRTEFTANGDSMEQSQVVQGFKGNWDITEQLSVSFNLEHTEPLGGDGNRLTSLALGSTWESLDGNWIVEADIDQTFEDSGRTLYTNFGAAGQISPSLTFLARSRYALDTRGDGPNQIRHRARVGLAYRPVENPRLDLLAWYEHQLEQGQQTTQKHMWSIDGAYEVSEDLRVNAKYAGQSVNFTMGGLGDMVEANTLTQLVQGGFIYDFGDNRWELGANLMHIWDNQGSATNALGLELGYVISEGTMISVGYNKSFGEAPNQSTLYQEGLFLRMRIVLDNSLWDRLGEFGLE